MNTEKRKKVVIVDDEQDWCLLMKSYLTKKGYDVVCFYDLQSAFPEIFQLHPDIVFLDNNLPDGIGWDKAEEIVEKMPESHINLISAYRSVAPTIYSTHVPQVKVWEKPLSFKELDNYFIQ